MAKRPGLAFRVRACLRCGGDAYFDNSEDAEWRCLQCGRLVPPVAALAKAPAPVGHAA